MKSTLSPCPKCNKINRVKLDGDGVGAKRPVCGHCRSELHFRGGVSEVSSAGLTQLIKSSSLPVIADFWASWCGPCRMFGPVFEKTARELSDQFVFVKVNSEENEDASRRYSIRSVPTLILFRGGEELNRIGGALPEPQFSQWLRSTMQKAAA